METVRLYAKDLTTKFGFCDGDMLDDIIYDLIDSGKLKINPSYFKSHNLLYDIIDKYLIPKLPSFVTLQFIDSIHNPVRADQGSPWFFCENSDVYVDVPLSEIVDMIITE